MFDAQRPRLLAALLMTSLVLAGCGKKGGKDNHSGSGDAQSQFEAATASVSPELAQAGVTAADLAGPSEPPVDFFHPDKRAVKPALGGRVIMHISGEPPNLNFAIENSAVIRWIYECVHAGLLKFNRSTWKMEPHLATSYEIEDTIILKGGRGKDNSNIVFGAVADGGDAWVVTSGSPSNPLAERRIPKADVASVEKGTVFTFHLRDNATWHDGKNFDSGDVMFSLDLFRNPGVDCDEKRYVFDNIVKGEALDTRTVRFFYKEQYFKAFELFGLDFPLLPSHLYNLLDPENKDHDPKASLSRQADYINDNPHNINFVGLGPYRLTTWERGRFMEAKKFDGYWEKDPAKSGYLDVLRWTHVDDDNLAFQALLNGELDIFYRVKSEDFMGQATSQPVFTNNFYKAFTYTGSLGYTSWNLYRKKLSDVRVRTALAHAFDVKEWIRTNYEGLALPATSSQFRFGPAYNQDVDVYPYDVEKAQALLADAGWYDRDGNGIVDKDGEDLVISVLMPTGNKASEVLLQKMQESFEKIGVKVTIQPFEWATFLEKILSRDFDACNLAWVITDVESDPYQIWHGNEAEFNRRTSNHAGLKDAVVDSLIDNIRIELDPARRHAMFMRLHERIYELQPYLFGWNVPRKLAFNKKLRGVKLYKFDPGYDLRDLYYEEGTPGTRPYTPGT